MRTTVKSVIQIYSHHDKVESRDPGGNSYQKMWKKFVRGCSPTLTPTQMLKTEFSTLRSQDTVSSSVSFQMMFEALQFEQTKFNFHLLGLKTQEFNFIMKL